MTDGEKEERELVSRHRAEEALGAVPTSFESPLTVLASPAWRGVEGDVWHAQNGDKSVILKHYHADTSFYVDTGSAIQAAVEAAKLGVGPTVIKHWVSDHIIAFEDLASPWRAGGLHDAASEKTRAAVIAAKQTFQNGAKLDKTSDIFSEIEALCGIVDDQRIRTHNDFQVFRDFMSDAQDKIGALGKDVKPCHRDGNTANLMIRENHEVQLIDFDLAANCDPFEDIGCYMAEFFECEADARPGFEEWHGSFDEGLFQRAVIYGLADDMRWGLIGSILAANSPRTSLEFGKYASWRFLRLEMQVKRSLANNRIRLAA